MYLFSPNENSSESEKDADRSIDLARSLGSTIGVSGAELYLGLGATDLKKCDITGYLP